MDFKDLYQKSIDKPEEFWKEISNDIFWFKKPRKILNKSNPLFIGGLKMELQIAVTTL